MSFHLTDFTYPLDSGGVFNVVAGDVLRVLPAGVPFGDAVVLGFNEVGECRLSRPYAYASGTGTTGPTVLMGAETYTVNVPGMRQIWQYGAGRLERGRFIT